MDTVLIFLLLTVIVTCTLPNGVRSVLPAYFLVAAEAATGNAPVPIAAAATPTPAALRVRFFIVVPFMVEARACITSRRKRSSPSGSGVSERRAGRGSQACGASSAAARRGTRPTRRSQARAPAGSRQRADRRTAGRHGHRRARAAVPHVGRPALRSRPAGRDRRRSRPGR